MTDVLTEHDFKPVIDKNMNNFYDEFEAVNLKSYEDVTSKYTEKFTNLH